MHTCACDRGPAVLVWTGACVGRSGFVHARARVQAYRLRLDGWPPPAASGLSKVLCADRPPPNTSDNRSRDGSISISVSDTRGCARGAYRARREARPASTPSMAAVGRPAPGALTATALALVGVLAAAAAAGPSGAPVLLALALFLVFLRARRAGEKSIRPCEKKSAGKARRSTTQSQSVDGHGPPA